MKVAYKHLLKFLSVKPQIEDLSNKLFQLGHEHEIDNHILDIEFTPNRGDCLSLLGLSRDLNVFYGTNSDLPIYNGDISLLDLNFINQSKEQCPRISFLNIEIEGKISKYKDYLEDYFIDLKINKNNFFTDVSNYIAYEMGQPTHCYEFSSIGSDITLKENKNNCKFTTLLNKSINLINSDLVFSSNKKIINLSGIIGGIDTACNKETNNALIECAYFKPESIIGKAVKYNLHSDASHKFERGTDPMCHEKVLRRFIQIISEHTKIIKLELYTDNNNFEEIELDFNINKVNKILGTSINENFYKNSLTKLGFNVNEVIKVPSYRSDISHQNDLAEELARVTGYDNIPVSSINLNESLCKLNSSNEKSLKDFLVTNGFVEVINSSFSSINNPDSIKVDNPLDSNREYIRTNLTDSLIENLIYNEKRQKDLIKLFEISDIYSSSKNIHERRLAIIISGRQGENYLKFSKKLDDKYLIELFAEKNIDISKFISNIDRNTLDSKIKKSIFAIELKIADLLKKFDDHIIGKESFSDFVKYEPISEFPSSYRDLSFSIQDVSMINDVIRILSDAKSSLVKKSFMFDFYQNKKINESKIGFRFIFQSNEKTLTDKEIDDEVKKIIKPILSIKSVTLPGFN